MCGIAGYLGPRALDPEVIDTCLRRMHRRGPDAAAYFEHCPAPNRHLYLLSTRLKIIDLDDRANQPYRAGSKVLIYNGELYNYVELKQELSLLRHTFKTESDTEVMLATLAEHGWRGLDKCEGMWALAMYDETDGSLLLSRDRFGEKPLYVYRDDSGVYFGSEVKFIAALLNRSLEVNLNHLSRYMVNGYKSLYKTDETFFLGVQELSPASCLTISKDGSQEQKMYWEPSFEQDDSLTYEDAVEGVRAALVRSVRLRLRADVPMAFCMSGGVDSNSLVGIAKRAFDYDVHGFTIMAEDARYEERAQVEHMVGELGLRHTAVPINSTEFRENLTEIIRQHDAPVYTISYYVHWLLMARIAEQGYRISISGTGADELLTGYYDHHNFYLGEVQDSPLFESALNSWNDNIAPIVRNPFLKNPRVFIENPGLRDHIYLNSTGFAEYLTYDWSESFAEKRYTSSVLRNRLLNELFHEVVPVILHEDDLNAMYFSIENRSPFLDRELFEICCRIPTSFLVRDGFAKVVLRDAMSGIVPDEILWNHRKVGFNAPILELLDVHDPVTREWLLDDGPIFEYVHRPMIEELIDRDFLKNSESKFLFSFLSSKLFTEQFAAP